MIIFVLESGIEVESKLMNCFASPDRQMELSVSLISVVSNIEHLVSSTNSVVLEEERLDSLVRLSVGTEGIIILRNLFSAGLNLRNTIIKKGWYHMIPSFFIKQKKTATEVTVFFYK